MNSLIANSQVKLDQELISMMKRIADHPTKRAINEALEIAAQEIIADSK